MAIGASKTGVLGRGGVSAGCITINSSTTWVAPAGVTKVTIVGKGGAGNAGTAGNSGTRGGSGQGTVGMRYALTTKCYGGNNPYNGPYYSYSYFNRSNAAGPGGAGQSPNGQRDNWQGPQSYNYNCSNGPGGGPQAQTNAVWNNLPAKSGQAGSAGSAGSAGQAGAATTGLGLTFPGGNAGNAGNAGNGGAGGGGASPNPGCGGCTAYTVNLQNYPQPPSATFNGGMRNFTAGQHWTGNSAGGSGCGKPNGPLSGGWSYNCSWENNTRGCPGGHGGGCARPGGGATGSLCFFPYYSGQGGLGAGQSGNYQSYYTPCTPSLTPFRTYGKCVATTSCPTYGPVNATNQRLGGGGGGGGVVCGGGGSYYFTNPSGPVYTAGGGGGGAGQLAGKGGSGGNGGAASPVNYCATISSGGSYPIQVAPGGTVNISWKAQ